MARRETPQEARERIWGNQSGAPSREREESDGERDRQANGERDRQASGDRDHQANAERDRESNGGHERDSNGDRDRGRGGSTRRDNRQSGQSDSTGGVLKRTIREFKQDNLTDWAAALTYYGILAIFPALIALVSILGLVGSSATQPMLDNLNSVAPGPAKEIFTSAIQNLQKSSGAAGVLFIVGLAGALWSASGYVAAFMRASNSIYDIEEGRPIWKTLPTRVGTTLVLLVLLAAVAIGVVLTGGLAKQVGNVIGLGDTAVSVWNIAKWPVMLLLVSFMFAFLYWAAPNVKHPKFSIITPGGILAVVIWLVASAAFAFYVSQFGSYNKTYGALGGVIVFLVWLWISNIAILLGAEFNAERERGHQMERGHPEDQEPFLEPRDTRKMENA
jgi:membrane protein